MDKVVSRDGTTIAYEKAGDGPPLVLLNGAFRDHTIFDQIVPQLTPYCTTYVYDRRGRGESGDAVSYAPEREIEDLEAVMEAAGGEVAVFAGSSGANLALRAAIHGTPMTRLALHEPYFRVPGFPRPPEDLIERMQSMLAEGRNAEVIEYWSHEFMDLSPEQYAIWRRNPTMWAENLTRTHTLIYDTTICAIRSDYDVPAQELAAFTTPTLLVNSDGTSDWLRAAAQATAAALPNCTPRTLPGGWHWVRPDILCPALAEFITQPSEVSHAS